MVSVLAGWPSTATCRGGSIHNVTDLKHEGQSQTNFRAQNAFLTLVGKPGGFCREAAGMGEIRVD